MYLGQDLSLLEYLHFVLISFLQCSRVARLEVFPVKLWQLTGCARRIASILELRREQIYLVQRL